MTNEIKTALEATATETNLHGYVSGVLLEAMEDYDNDIEAVWHDAMNGTGSGWWSDLIYYRDIAQMYNKHRSDTIGSISDFMDMCGIAMGDTLHREHDETFGDAFKALANVSFIDLNSGEPFTDEEHLAMDCLKLAVEIVASDITAQFDI